jgi:hypothetical protein
MRAPVGHSSRCGRFDSSGTGDRSVGARSPYTLDRLLVWLVRASVPRRMIRPLVQQVLEKVKPDRAHIEHPILLVLHAHSPRGAQDIRPNNVTFPSVGHHPGRDRRRSCLQLARRCLWRSQQTTRRQTKARRDLVENVEDAMVPAALVPGRRGDLGEGGPQTERTVATGN